MSQNPIENATSETETVNVRTYMVRVENRSTVEEKLSSLQRRAMKLGVPGFTWFWGTERAIRPQSNIPSGTYISDRQLEALKPYVAVELTMCGADHIGVDGWRLVGAIEHTDNGNLVYATTSNPFPSQYQTARANCDHCGHNRNRNWTFILQDTTDKLKQVGSTCLKDFTGHRCDSIASYGELLKDIRDALLEGETLGADARGWRLLDEFLAQIAHLIGCFGWTPKSAAATGMIPTIAVFDELEDKGIHLHGRKRFQTTSVVALTISTIFV